MKCPNCNAEGRGPRFEKRHLSPDSVCTRNQAAKAERAAYTKRLAECRSLDHEEFDRGESVEDHYLAVVQLRLPYMWIGHDGQHVDLRAIDGNYAVNLGKWIETFHSLNTPYMNTAQYKVVESKIKWLNIAKNVLKQK